MKIAVSACLLGENCKYNGGNNAHAGVRAFVQGHAVLPVCPECMGGLPVPRKPAEIVDGRVRCADGADVHEAFCTGARLACEAIAREGVSLVILQPRSPSCGLRQRYDGSFSGRLIEGQGVFARMLLDRGFAVAEASDYALPGDARGDEKREENLAKNL